MGERKGAKMVILIGAASNTGKTLMSQKLLELYKMPYLSLDWLKMGLYRANEKCGFTPEDGNEKIEQILWPIIKGIVMTNIENKQNIIIEGCYIFPNRIKEFEHEYMEHIIPVFIGFSKAYIENNFLSTIIRHASAIEEKGNEERAMTHFIDEHSRFKRMCEESEINYFEITKDYTAEIENIYQWIDEEVSIKKLIFQ
jgi:hypothetical protein